MDGGKTTVGLFGVHQNIYFILRVAEMKVCRSFYRQGAVVKVRLHRSPDQSLHQVRCRHRRRHHLQLQPKDHSHRNRLPVLVHNLLLQVLKLPCQVQKMLIGRQTNLNSLTPVCLSRINVCKF